MKWIIGVGIVALSPLIILIAVMYAIIVKLPLIAYSLAREFYQHKTEKKHEGIGWYK
jgi:ABC-type transport system involved in cytochrome bd biosynthesis fused ATPase/permease subunit